MKRRNKFGRFGAVACVLLLLCASVSPVFAGTNTTGGAVIPISGAGIQIDMQGSVTPTILSVTLPSNIEFEISRGNAGDNKVLSPEIPVTNGSGQGVYIYARDTQVDVSALGYNTQYVPSTSGGSIQVATGGALFVSGSGIMLTEGAIQVEPNEIAIGMSSEWVAPSGAVMPSLNQARWLIEDPYQQTWRGQTEVAYVPGNGTVILHIVGTLGRDVPEERGFTVRPTMIASYWPSYGW